MKTVLKIGSVAALMLAAGVNAGCATDPDAVVAKDPTRIVCRTEAQTGSRLPSRECKEAREWQALADEAERLGRNMQREQSKPSDLPSVGGGGR